MRNFTIALVCAGVLAIGLLGARLVWLGRAAGFGAARAEATSNAQQPMRPAVRQPVTDLVVNSADGLTAGWLDFGYSRHTMRKGSVVEVDFAGYGGLILSHPGSLGPFGGLAFRYRA